VQATYRAPALRLPTWAVKSRAGPPIQYSTMLFSLSKQNIFLLFASSILATATAQDSTTAQDDASTSSAPPDPSPWPTATIFLPGNLHDLPGAARNLAASVITAVSLVDI
jgi:hypothetical protein